MIAFARGWRDSGGHVGGSVFCAGSTVIPGSTIGITSRQCVFGGIGNTNRSSRIAPDFVSDGNQYGVVVSPSRIRLGQKMWMRCLLLLPVRNASGTKPIASQKKFA